MSRFKIETPTVQQTYVSIGKFETNGFLHIWGNSSTNWKTWAGKKRKILEKSSKMWAELAENVEAQLAENVEEKYLLGGFNPPL